MAAAANDIELQRLNGGADSSGGKHNNASGSDVQPVLSINTQRWLAALASILLLFVLTACLNVVSRGRYNDGGFLDEGLLQFSWVLQAFGLVMLFGAVAILTYYEDPFTPGATATAVCNSYVLHATLAISQRKRSDCSGRSCSFSAQRA